MCTQSTPLTQCTSIGKYTPFKYVEKKGKMVGYQKYYYENDNVNGLTVTCDIEIYIK